MESHGLSLLMALRRSSGSSIRSNRFWKTSSTSHNGSLSFTPTTTRLHIDPTHLEPPGSPSVVLILVSALPTSVSEIQRLSMLRGPLPPPSRLKLTCRATGKLRNVLSLGTVLTTGFPSRNTSMRCSVTAVIRRSTTSRLALSPLSGRDTTRLEESGYLQFVEQFVVSKLASYLMDPLGNFQVCSPLKRQKHVL